MLPRLIQVVERARHPRFLYDGCPGGTLRAHMYEFELPGIGLLNIPGGSIGFGGVVAEVSISKIRQRIEEAI